MKNITYFLLLAITTISHAQNTKINGIISDKLGIITNAHVYNLTTKQGTYTNEEGQYSLNVSLGDKIQVSSIQHFNKTFTIANITLKQKKLNIVLTLKTYVLDAVEIKKYNLIGTLTTDLKQVTKDTIRELISKMNLSLQNIPRESPLVIKYGKDELHQKKIHVSTVPNISLGVSVKVSLDNSGYIRKLKRQKQKKLEEFPDKLKNELGEVFFFKTLKIPENKYYHFITYVSIQKDIQYYFEKNNIFKLINVLKEEATTYIKAQKNHN